MSTRDRQRARPPFASMSSIKHEPNTRKRQHSEIDDAFPSQPNGGSFTAALEFASRSQAALLSIKGLHSVDFSQTPSLSLPLITPHQLQARFNVTESDSVLVVVRKSFTHLKKEVELLNNRVYSGLYVW